VTAPARPARVAVHRYAVTWHVTIFMGMQSLLYYATLSWLPTMLRDRGESAAAAGDLLALMGVGKLAVSLFIPMAAQRMRSQVALVVPTTVAVAAGLAGLLYLPLGGAVAWALILGAGQNAALALASFFTAARAPLARECCPPGWKRMRWQGRRRRPEEPRESGPRRVRPRHDAHRLEPRDPRVVRRRRGRHRGDDQPGRRAQPPRHQAGGRA